jgi:hypothetical protein
MNNPDNPNAFPEPSSGPYPNGEIVQGREGMSLRDYFAGQALAGMLANQRAYDEVRAEVIANMSYDQADEMLKVRSVI